MFERFSSGYYLGRLYVEPADGDRAVMQRAHHEAVNEQLYASGEGVERLDIPLVMKLGQAHLPVHAADEIPERTLAVPESTLEAAGIRNPPTLSEVLLATKETASQLFAFEGPPV
jgi:hypothetical protein